ncbi:MAG: diaminopimelate decarboxylase [Ignavibacteriaceae bacterium]|nr:diaminopimelate decarboxylase [Ignavibacterium sp.]MCC6254367.1 diaminopimelate decarboxylase [Ignavibacteriaceae bacterium]HRN25563.1 diaminopimelate decarboxylase [Ignavibacteriaceae bacterium]HRP92351.1 diaminopimelate decarboxylase [Ignavibacteriaceae bacterium]HRQ53094.1 diaminopimelate decarboxylase [Ignavibacteriaceae bacterium]
MHYIETEFINYKNNQLFVEEIKVEDLAKEFETPLYIYSKNHFIKQYKDFEYAFKDVNHKIFYAMKANFNLSVINTFVKLGSGVDANSEGELFRALKAGADPSKIILTSVGKTKNEIKLGLEHNVLMIKAESEEEIELINIIAQQMNKIARVAIRVNPDVDAKTHPYISTGLSSNKFGVDSKTALSIYKRRIDFSNIQFTGIDMHIGSQITSIDPFVEAVQKLSELYFEIEKDGLKLEHFDVGGGIGVNYNDEKLFTIDEFAEKTIPLFKKLNCEIIFEPGRFLTANGGILVTEVLYNKKNGNKNFIIVDAAMNDLLRPSIYQAYHNIQPLEKFNGRKEIVVDVVGPVCETGDYFARDRKITEMKSGEFISIMSSGAYGIVMSSNYNARRRPAEILVDGNKYFVIRSRETFEHLLWDEKIIQPLFFSPLS